MGLFADLRYWLRTRPTRSVVKDRCGCRVQLNGVFVPCRRHDPDDTYRPEPGMHRG